jgi:nitrite reductase/ring-hydroxylating ferredoxin subunit
MTHSAHPASVVCESASLIEGGKAKRFAIASGDLPVACFAIRFDGKVHGYVNSCPHRGTELDWNPGEIFDESGLYLVCATHGAMFDPETGECVSGPCRGAALHRVDMDEQNGVVRVMRRVP